MADMFDLKGKTAVITGAGRGLGLAFASALASAGCSIAALDLLPTPDPALYALRTPTIKVEYYIVDVTSRPQVTDAIATIVNHFGQIDININAAGIVKDEPFLSTSDANLSSTFAVNVTGSFLVAQACAATMVSRYRADHGDDKPATSPTTGSIVFVASIATYIASSAQNISCYTASKAAIRGLVKPVAMELARYGIRVNSLSPGYTMTDMMRGLQAEQPGLVAQFEHETLFGRIGLPEELAGAMLWLCCDRASGWYTGQDLLVDGGATAWKHPAAM